MIVHKTGISDDPERFEFERWYLRTQTKSNYRRIVKSDVSGVYFDRVTTIAWRTWQAATARAKGAEGGK